MFITKEKLKPIKNLHICYYLSSVMLVHRIKINVAIMFFVVWCDLQVWIPMQSPFCKLYMMQELANWEEGDGSYYFSIHYTFMQANNVNMKQIRHFMQKSEYGTNIPGENTKCIVTKHAG